jgi:ligand-binding SRPBCC domain-containing protein
MKTYILKREQLLPIGIGEAWEFFSAPANLAKITPPGMGFKVLTKLDGSSIYNGMKIDYKVSPLLRIPMSWTTEILDVQAPVAFKDRQQRGPYALWEHTHTFELVKGGVLMTDSVKYALKLGLLGKIAHSVLVRKRLEDIFNYRYERLIELFGQYKA